MVDKNNKQKILHLSPYDIARMLCSDNNDWSGVVSWNEIAYKNEWLKPPPFASQAYYSGVGNSVTNEDIAQIEYWFCDQKRWKTSFENVKAALKMIAGRNRHNPLKDYLQSLTWDGTARIESYFRDEFGVDNIPNDLLLTASRGWFIGCVARAMKPGCEMHNMLILKGSQYLGKSKFFKALAGDKYFSDQALDIDDVDGLTKMRGKWLYEVAELSSFSKKDENGIKHFLTRTHDEYRAKYAPLPEEYPRLTVFVGTTNDTEFLKDYTGNRRFWIFDCQKCPTSESVKAIRDQLWAEAVYYYKQGEQYWLDNDDTAEMNEAVSKFIISDPLTESIKERAMRDTSDAITMDTLRNWIKLAECDINKPNTLKRAERGLEQLGYKKQQSRKHNRQRVWVAPPNKLNLIESNVECLWEAAE